MKISCAVLALAAASLTQCTAEEITTDAAAYSVENEMEEADGSHRELPWNRKPCCPCDGPFRPYTYYGYGGKRGGKRGPYIPSCRQCPCPNPTPGPTPSPTPGPTPPPTATPCDSKVGDTVYLDENGNGIQDGGEPGIGGVTIDIYKDGVYLASDTTDNNGFYIFDDLCAGEYCIYITDDNNVLDGLTETQVPATCLTLGNDDTFLDQDYGFEEPCLSQIGDTVFMDVDGNGFQDYNDYGIAGVTLQLLDGYENVVATTMTDGNGYYLFSDLCEGDYCVRVLTNAQLSELTPTGPKQSVSCTYVDGYSSDLEQDFGYNPPLPCCPPRPVPPPYGKRGKRGYYNPYEPYQPYDPVWPPYPCRPCPGPPTPGPPAPYPVPPPPSPLPCCPENPVGDWYYPCRPCPVPPPPTPVPPPPSPLPCCPENPVGNWYYPCRPCPVPFPAPYGPAPYGKRGPAPYGKRGPAPYGAPYGKRGPAPYGAPYGKRGPAPYGKRGPAPYAPYGKGKGYDPSNVSPYGKRGPAPYGKRGPYPGPAPYGKRGPYPGPAPYGKRGPAPYGKRGPYPGPAPYGKRGPAPYGKRGPVPYPAPVPPPCNSNIGDTVFIDRDCDGVQDSMDSGVSGVTIELLDEYNYVVATTTTDYYGYYLFSYLCEGRYCVRVTDYNGVLSGATPTGPKVSVSCTYVNGFDSDFDQDFGYCLPTPDPTPPPTPPPTSPPCDSVLGDTVYLDVNGNNRQDDDEPGIADVTLSLYCNGEMVTSAITDSTGYYIFDDLCACTNYCVYVTDNNEKLDGLVPTQVPATCLELDNNDVFLDQDYGYKPPCDSEVGDTVYLDVNGNNVQDDDEPGIADVTLSIYCDGELVATDTTDSSGYYLFDDLCACRYCVYVTDDNDVLDGLRPTQVPATCLDLGDNDSFLDQDYGYKPPTPKPGPKPKGPLPCCPPGKYGFYGYPCRPCGKRGGYGGKRGGKRG